MLLALEQTSGQKGKVAVSGHGEALRPSRAGLGQRSKAGIADVLRPVLLFEGC